MASTSWGASTPIWPILSIIRFGVHRECPSESGCSFRLVGAPPLRHKSFRSEQELRQFLSERAMHSCHSTAYWQKPYELKMDDKNWQGADLIFDLDGDHLPV